MPSFSIVTLADDIAPSPAFMATRQFKLTCGRAVGSKIVGHKLVPNKGHFPDQFPCRPLVPLALKNNVKDFGIDGEP